MFHRTLFQGKIISCGYHVFKETTWNNVKEGDTVTVDLKTNQLSMNVDLYSCAICVKNQFFNLCKTVGHIPWKISRRVYYFIKTKGGSVNGSIISTKYRPVSVSSDWLEMLLLLKFSCPEQKTKLKLISQNQSVTRRMISQNWPVTLKVIEKKKTSTLTLILMYQLVWPS